MNVWGDSKERNWQPTNTNDFFNKAATEQASRTGILTSPRISAVQFLPLRCSVLTSLPISPRRSKWSFVLKRCWYAASAFIIAMTYLIISKVWILIHFPRSLSFGQRHCRKAFCVILINGAKNVTPVHCLWHAWDLGVAYGIRSVTSNSVSILLVSFGSTLRQ